MARTLAEIFGLLVDDSAPVGFRAYDGSAVERAGAVGVVEVRSPRALRYLTTAPGELGLARAYVTGDLELRGDLYSTLQALAHHCRRPIPWGALLGSVRRWMLRRPSVPAEEAPPPWMRGAVRHGKRRDARAISHHYDVSDRFYELLLGPTMTYSCAVFDREDATLEEAQREKLDLVCRKLDLQPGQRLLDVGAGWGGLVRHAAEHYGVRAVGVTLSRPQAEWAGRTIRDAGLRGRAEVRHLDYRDLHEGDFDAIASVGAMEHFGSAELAVYFGSMLERLRPGGRMLNHCITRSSGRQRHRTGPFIDRYVFPDGELESVTAVIGSMNEQGFEIRHEENLREHYALTLREWGRNLERHWARAVAQVGERRARVWRLYMAVSRIGFTNNDIQIHQVLGVRVDREGRSGMPPRPLWRPREQPPEDHRPRRAVRRSYDSTVSALSAAGSLEIPTPTGQLTPVPPSPQ
ncbi:MAG TPA: cyclopropane-fatty-acyl-phospholipid synthase family protein [Solirubrobacteraceae bacterium]|nr:cyclopropane-fatty-acyl-phospholipid synthase family protein [Solirubrobacteraceae bacterium]